MEFDTEESVAKFIFSYNDTNNANIKDFKEALYLLMNFLNRNHEGNSNIVSRGEFRKNYINSNLITKVKSNLNTNLMYLKKIIMKFCKYKVNFVMIKKDVLKISQNIDKIFEKYTLNSIPYIKNINNYYQALEEENILIKQMLKNLIQDTKERLSSVIIPITSRKLSWLKRKFIKTKPKFS
jgi:hypothetical protein